jgi:hypothetical protein
MRPGVVAAVAERDLRRVLAGRRGFIGLALALLLPLGAIPVAMPAREQAAIPAVQGEVPAALEGRLRLSEDAPVRLSGSDPIRVQATSLPASVRDELERIEGEPSVTRMLWRPELRLPGRNLLVALLAISLLTGPLAESLPGEREEGTLETLLAAAISRGELVGGKWLAWTVGAGDAMSGATAPMRVIPVVAVALLGLSWWLAPTSAVLAAAVPLGGGLLMAGGMVTQPLAVLAALCGTAAATAALLAGTAAALTRTGDATRRGGGLLVAGAVLWWLPVHGPAIWRWAGRPELVDAEAGLLAGGALLLLASLVALARDPHLAPPRRPTGPGLAAGVAAGVLLALTPGAPATPIGVALIAVVLGQELWFRGVLQARLGAWRTAAAWVVIVGAVAPLHAAASGLLLCGLSSRYGVFAAIVAALVWRVAG